MAAPRLDYGSSAQPQVQRLNDALQLANEQQLELGLSGLHRMEARLRKLKADAAFWQKAGCGYSVSSFYTGGAAQKTLHETLFRMILWRRCVRWCTGRMQTARCLATRPRR